MAAFNSWMDSNGPAVIRALLIILLVLVIWLVIRLIILIGKFSKAGDKVNNSLDIFQDYLGEMKLPVRAIVNVSMSIEALRAAGEAQIRAFSDKLAESYQKVMEYLKQIWDSISKIKKDEEAEPESDPQTAEEIPDNDAGKGEKNG